MKGSLSPVRRTAGLLVIAVLACLGQAPRTPSEGEFFDSKRIAVVYLDDGDVDRTFYLWSEGEPLAYMDDDSLYGFNGKHLGWLRNGAVYDHDGNAVAATARRFKEPVQSPPPKGPKQYRPYKDYKEYKPYKPVFEDTWSKMTARAFFLQGRK
jgi:hypothetical protein